jgi:hypothetical protein
MTYHCRKGSYTLLAAVMLVGFVASGAGAVNPPKKTLAERVNRGLLVGNCAFVDERTPAVTAGGFTQVSLTKLRVEAGSYGNEVIIPPRWYAHLMVTGGSRTDLDDYAVFGQLGVIRRNDSETFTSAGIVGQAVLPVKAYGPAGRIEVMDILGLQAGPIYFHKAKAWGVFASIDFFHLLFDDLGLKP